MHFARPVFEKDQAADDWNLKLRHHDLAAVPFNARDRFINRIDTDRAFKTKDWFAFNDFAPRMQRTVNAGSGRKF